VVTNRVPYQTSLRVLGRLLNGDKARAVTVCEVDGGFLLHYILHGDPGRVHSRAIHNAEALDLDDLFHAQRGKPDTTGSFKGLRSVFGFRQGEALRFQKSHPLCPMGYEEALRAVGAALDMRNARAVLVCELDTSLHVEYTVERVDFVVRDGQRLALAGRRQDSYTADGVATLVRTCREQAIEKVRRNGQNLSYNPLDAASYLRAALALDDDGQYREAEELCRKAADLAPEQAEARYHLARYARHRGDRKAAQKLIERAIALQENDGRFFHLLGRLHADRGRVEEAADALRRAVACEPDNTVYRFDLERVGGRLEPADAGEGVLSRLYGGASPTPVSPTPASIQWRDAPRSPGSLAAPDVAAGADAAGAMGAEKVDADGGDGAPRARSLMARLEAYEEVAALDVALHREDDQRVSGAEPADAVSTGADMRPGAAWDDPFAAPPLYAVAPPAAPAMGHARGDLDREAGPLSAATSWGDPAPLPDIPASAATFAGTGETLDAPGLPATAATAEGWTGPALPSPTLPSYAAGSAAALPLAAVGGADPGFAPSSERAPVVPLELPAFAERADVAPAGSADTHDAVQLAAAILWAEDLVRAEPGRAELHRKLGFLLAKQGRSEEAAAAFRRAAECGRRRLG